MISLRSSKNNNVQETVMTTILHMTPCLGANGAARQLSLLAPELGRRGINVHVAAIGEGELFAKPLLAGGTPVHSLGARGPYDPRAWASWRRLVAELRPDVVHAWRRSAVRWALAARPFYRFRLTAGDLLWDRCIGSQLDAI